ncbi:MAG: NAD(P)-dependent oxidoreductase [Candidatus Nanopelagicaceae bacterium]|nr:NAD(P)-dependent oxidoreductase [Candidatus Nanopelagicaceae bacterium]
MSRILIFGSAGLLGLALTEKFTKSGHEVFAINRSMSHHPGAKSFQGDILDSGSYLDTLNTLSPDVVISTAWLTSLDFWESESNYEYMRATINLAEHSFAGGVQHFIGIGSAAEFGIHPTDCDSDSSSMVPLTAYGKAKFETGRTISEIATRYGKDFSWLRVFQAYGKGERSHRLIPQVIEKLSRGDSFTLLSASKVLDWIHSDDVANAAEFALELNDGTHFMDVGTGEGTDVITIVRSLAKILDVPEGLIDTPTDGSIPDTTRLVSTPHSHLRKVGWAPKITLDQGLTELTRK